MGAEAGATNGFLLNTLKTIFGPSRVLLHISCITPPKRRYKICTFSVILGELESSGNYKGFSYCHRHQSTNESPSSFKNRILDIHFRNIVPYILPATGVQGDTYVSRKHCLNAEVHAACK